MHLSTMEQTIDTMLRNFTSMQNPSIQLMVKDLILKCM